MQAFDLYLEASGELDVARVARALRDIEHLHPTPEDPARFIYRNPDTSVHFMVLVGSAIARALRPPKDDEHGYGDAWSGVDSAAEEGEGERGYEDEDDDEEEHEDDDEEEAADDAVPAELSPVTLSAPLFRPSFFVRELLEVAERLRAATGLRVIDPHREGEEEGGAVRDEADRVPGDEEGLRSWTRLHEEWLPRVRDPNALARWPREKAEDFFDYGRLRPSLVAELEPAGVGVPRIQVALHQGAVKTLCVWNIEHSTVLPRTDLILLQEPAEKRGLLRRRVVIEERLVSCDAVWSIIAPFAEVRREPVRHLVFRRPETLPQQLVHGLEKLEGEPVEEAKRTDLTGVIDIRLPDTREGAA